jgi:hypothetical protein
MQFCDARVLLGARLRIGKLAFYFIVGLKFFNPLF